MEARDNEKWQQAMLEELSVIEKLACGSSQNYQMDIEQSG